MTGKYFLSIVTVFQLVLSQLCTQTALAQEAAHKAPVDFDLSSTTANLTAGNFTAKQPVTIKVGQTYKTVGPSDMVTAAERIAAYQVYSTGQQSLILGAAGNAVGGTFTISQRLTQLANNLTIPQNVTAVDNAAHTAMVNLAGNLTNGGTIYAVTSSLGATTASLAAQNIFNQPGALITSVLPANGSISSVVSNLNLNLSAIQNIVNAGTISSAGMLTAHAGGTITNVLPAGSPASSQLPIMSGLAGVALYSGAGNIVNGGVITSALGNIDLSTANTRDLIVNNIAGLIQAQLGSINVRDASYSGKNYTSIIGGTLKASTFNLNAGNGALYVNVDKLTGLTDVFASKADIFVNHGSLRLGKISITGDPTFAAQDSITLSDLGLDQLDLHGQDLAIVSGGDIEMGNLELIDLSCTGACLGRGGDLTMLAGVSYTPPVDAGPNGETSFLINGPSATGGNFNSNQNSLTIKTNTADPNSARGGNVRIVAFGTVDGNLQGGHLNFSGSIDTHSETGDAGDVQMFAPVLNINNAIINANGGPQANGGNVALQGFLPAVADRTTILNGALSLNTGGQITNGNTRNWSPFYPVRPGQNGFDESLFTVTIKAPFSVNASGKDGTGSFYVDTSGEIAIILNDSSCCDPIGASFSVTTSGPVTFGHPTADSPITQIPGVAAPFFGPVTPGHPFNPDLPIPTYFVVNEDQGAGQFNIDAKSVTITAGDIYIYRDRPIGRDFNITAENGDVILSALTGQGGSGRIEISAFGTTGGGSGGCGGGIALDPCGAVNVRVAGGNILYFAQGGNIEISNPDAPSVFDAYSAISSTIPGGFDQNNNPILYGKRGGGIEMWAGPWKADNPNHLSFTTSNFTTDPNANPDNPSGLFVIEQVNNSVDNLNAVTINTHGYVFIHAGAPPDPINLQAVGLFSIQAFPPPPGNPVPPCLDCEFVAPPIVLEPPPPVVEPPKFESNIILKTDSTNFYATPAIEVPQVCYPTIISSKDQNALGSEIKQWTVASNSCQPFSLDMDGDTFLVGSAGTAFAPSGHNDLALKEGRMALLSSATGTNVTTALGKVKVGSEGAVIIEEKTAGVLRVINLTGGQAEVQVGAGDSARTMSCMPGQEMIVADAGIGDEELIDVNGVERQPVEGSVTIAGGFKTKLNNFDRKSMLEKEPLLLCNQACLTPREKKRLKDMHNQLAGVAHKPAVPTAQRDGGRPMVGARGPIAPDLIGVSAWRPVSYTTPAQVQAPSQLKTLNAPGCSIRSLGDGEVSLEQDGSVNLSRGQALVSTSQQTAIRCGAHKITLDGNTIAVVTRNGDQVKVDNLYDSHDSAAHVVVDGKRLDISAGQEVIVGLNDGSLLRSVRQDKVTRRRMKQYDLPHGLGLVRSEISYVSMFLNSQLLSELLRSNNTADQDITARIIKMAACVTTVTSGHGVYLPIGS